MAYFYNSSNYYSEIPDNYQYYNNHDYSYNYDPRYVQSYNTEFQENAYQHVSTPPLVGYYYSNYSQPESLSSKNALFHENGDYYDEAVSTEYVVSYNTTAETEAKDVVSEEYNPKPFQGGYDINEQYGKPMSPSEKICYPPSNKDKIDPNLNGGNNSFGSVPNPYVNKEDKKVESEGEPKSSNGVNPNKVVQEEHPSDFEDGDEEDDYDDEDDDEYDDEYDDEEEEYDDGDEKGGEKHGDLGKEASEAAVIASLGSGGVGKKQDQNVEGVAKPQNEGIAGEVIQEKKASDFEAAKKEEEEEDDLGKGEEKQGDLGDKEPSKTIIPVTSLGDAISEKEAKNLEDEAKPKNGSIAGEVIQEQKPSNFEKIQEQQQKEGNMSDEVSKVEDNGNQIRRQIPPGYGMEALDLCEGLFGGYFPCLWKRKQGNNISTNANTNNNQQSGNYYYENMSDYDYCCKETVDYLFGNPNPYGGSMPEKGSYGDPVYSYQRYYPQQPLTEQVDCYGPRYYYGHTGDYHQ